MGVAGIFILAMTGVAFVVGALSNLFFFNDPQFGNIAIVAAERRVDQIIPLFIDQYMPSWLGAVIVVTLLAAAMSTVSSQFHAMGSAAGRDLYETCSGAATTNQRSILATRIGITVTLLDHVNRCFECIE